LLFFVLTENYFCLKRLPITVLALWSLRCCGNYRPTVYSRITGHVWF